MIKAGVELLAYKYADIGSWGPRTLKGGVLVLQVSEKN
eukprot:SAG22_NODE_11360_length_488_cov_1.578406_1_plen_37_part_01